jgi:ketosteroid isomerase-like protein
MNRVASACIVLGFAAAVSCTRLPNREKGKEALLQADRDFAAETARRGAEGWADFFTEDGVMFLQKGYVEGREAIRKRMQPVFEDSTFRLLWEPTAAVVGSGGDVGYTLGRWRQVLARAGQPDSTLATGNYVSIWRKVRGAGWRVAVDIGNSDA